MNCFVHPSVPAVGLCAACQKAVCRDCVAGEAPRLVCAGCQGKAILGFEYRSRATLFGWPLVHVCMGVDPGTMRPKVARGVIAIGNIAIGGFALGGVAGGLVSVGGLSLGCLLALGGAALGFGFSFGGLAVGAIAVGGLAVGAKLAVGGAAFGPAIVDGMRCDPAARALLLEVLSRDALPPACRH